MNKKQKIQPVYNDTARGSWHGRDAWQLSLKRMLSVLILGFFFFLLSVLLSFGTSWVQVIISLFIVAAAGLLQYHSGVNLGERDAALGEIVAQKEKEGREVSKEEREHCFHPAKGYFATMIGCLPFFILCLVFAFLTKKVMYTLGTLPSWTTNLRNTTAMGDALHYYTLTAGVGFVDVARVIVRAMTMPFLSIFMACWTDGALLCERLSPLLILLVPMCYGAGYAQGLKARAMVNTGIQIGEEKKRRKERREKKKRMEQSKKPEQLI